MKATSKIVAAAVLVAAFAFPALAAQNQASEPALSQGLQASGPYAYGVQGTVHHIAPPSNDMQLDGRGF